MKAIVLESHNTPKLRDIPIPTPKENEILIRTKAATICTSDILDMKHNLFNLSLPVVMGHEAAGIVEAIGKKAGKKASDKEAGKEVADIEATDIKIGDEVAVHPVMPCLKCRSCKRGLKHLCDDMEHLAFNRPGVFAEYFTTRPDCVRKKPPGISFELASLMEPVCVCIEALDRAAIKPGNRLLIAGDGPFGLMISKLATFRGTKQIILTGMMDYRLKQAHHSVCTINGTDTPDMAKAVMELTNGEGVESAILCVSNPDALDMAIEVLCSRGTLAVFSALTGKTPVDLLRVHLKELTLTGSNNDEDYMDDAIRYLADPKLDLNSIITHTFPFEEWQEAFRLAETAKDKSLKISMMT